MMMPGRLNMTQPGISPPEKYQSLEMMMNHLTVGKFKKVEKSFDK